jgi:hypothetical protein
VLVVVGIWGTLDFGEGVLFQLLHDYFDGFLELSVVPLSESSWIEIYFDIRGNAAVFNFPFAVEAIDGGTWSRNAAAIDEFRIAADSDEATPGFLTD